MAIDKKLPVRAEATEPAKDEKPRALEPSFGLSEGTRQELEMNGHAVSPFTGALLVGTGVNDVREVEAKEYHRVAKEAAAKRLAGKPQGKRFPKA